MARAFEGRFEVLKVVDFTVENQNVAPVSRAHWLMPLATQVLNCQSTMRQADSGLRIGPDALIVGSPMTECCSDVQRQFLQLESGEIARRINEPSYSTHKKKLSEQSPSAERMRLSARSGHPKNRRSLDLRLLGAGVSKF